MVISEGPGVLGAESCGDGGPRGGRAELSDPKMGRDPFSIHRAPVLNPRLPFLMPSICPALPLPRACHISIHGPTLASGPEARAHVPDRCGERAACPAQHRRWPTPPLAEAVPFSLDASGQPFPPGAQAHAEPALHRDLRCRLSRDTRSPPQAPPGGGKRSPKPPSLRGGRRASRGALAAHMPSPPVRIGEGCSAPPGDVRRAEPGPAALRPPGHCRLAQSFPSTGRQWRERMGHGRARGRRACPRSQAFSLPGHLPGRQATCVFLAEDKGARSWLHSVLRRPSACWLQVSPEHSPAARSPPRQDSGASPVRTLVRRRELVWGSRPQEGAVPHPGELVPRRRDGVSSPFPPLRRQQLHAGLHRGRGWPLPRCV